MIQCPRFRFARERGFLFTESLHYYTVLPVDANSVVREIRKTKPEAPRYRAVKGSWVKPAWAVRKLVEEDRWTVADAVREVIDRMKLGGQAAPGKVFASIRVAYYVVKNKPWSDEPK